MGSWLQATYQMKRELGDAARRKNNYAGRLRMKRELALYNLNHRGRGRISMDEYLSLLKTCNYKCLACGGKEDPRHPLGLDHIVPVVLGGTSRLHNLQLLCKQCNNRKGTKIVDYRCDPPRSYIVDDSSMTLLLS